jgi:hypothetical protein
MSAPSPSYPQSAGMSYYNPSTAPQTAPPMYGENEVPMSVQLPGQVPMSNSATPTPMQMATTPVPPMSSMPGSNIPDAWSYHHSQSQSEPQSQSQTQGSGPAQLQELTPILQVKQVSSSDMAEGESEIEDDDSKAGSESEDEA